MPLDTRSGEFRARSVLQSLIVQKPDLNLQHLELPTKMYLWRRRATICHGVGTERQWCWRAYCRKHVTVHTFRRVPGEIGAAEPDHAKARFELATPATLNENVPLKAPGDNLPLGRNEATMALESLLQVAQYRKEQRDHRWEHLCSQRGAHAIETSC